MKNVLRALLLALFLLAMLLLVPSGALVGQAEIIEIPVDAKPGDMIEPQAAGFLSDWEYQDPSISVRIEKGRYCETTYMVAYVKIANASQIRSAMAGRYGDESKEFGRTLAQRWKAVLAINGDYFIGHNNVGFVTRQGRNYRTKCDNIEDNSGLRMDVLIIDDKGDLHILPQATNADIAAFPGEIINGFSFGPGLVIDGVKQTGFVNMNNGALIQASRMCIAQTGELEYLCIATEGPEDEDHQGLTMEQFADLVASFEGVQNAYNLDGGSSSTMTFKQNGKYLKVNSPTNPKQRELKDILFFCSAYLP